MSNFASFFGLKCMNCSHSINSNTDRKATFFSCESCGTVHDLTKGIYPVIVQKMDNPEESYLNIGTKGLFLEKSWTVVGIVKKKVKGTNYNWIEFTLYNSIEGYIYLSLYHGHWTYFKEIKSEETINANDQRKFNYQDKSFQIFSDSLTDIVWAKGEFNYDISTDYDYQVKEYISPPFKLSKEIKLASTVWFIGEYVEKSVIEKAFSCTTLPNKVGVSDISPPKFNFNLQFIYTILLLIILAIFFGFSKSEKFISKYEYIISDTIPSSKSIKTPIFELKEQKNLQLTFSSMMLNNDWIEADFTLINESTDEEFYFSSGLEYYSGADWTEGSHTNDIILSSIPKGIYHINIFPAVDVLRRNDLSIEIKSDVSTISNFWIILLIILPIWGLLEWNRSDFENRRWYNSDYLPTN